MFSDIIRETPFSTKAANAYFADKIDGDTWNGDSTLVSTLRAILSSRIGDGTIRISYCSFGLNQNRFSSYSEDELIRIARENTDYGENSFVVITISSGHRETDAKYYETLEKGFASDGWARIPTITEFFKKNFDVLCFVKEETKQTVYFFKEFNSRICHYMQLTCLPAVPWYFNPAGGDSVSEQELDLLNSLTEKTPENYLAKLSEFVKAFDFRTAYIKSIIGGIETAYEEQRLSSLKSSIEEKMSAIRAWRDRINDAYRTINGLNAELFGLETKIKESGEESIIVDYFIRNRRLAIDNVSGTQIAFHVNDYLSYFDEEMAERFINNKRSCLYSSAPDKEAAEKLARALFIDGTIRLRVCAGYTLDMRGSFNGNTNYDFGIDGIDRFPNSHINNHACLGTYESVIYDKLENRDFIGVLEQACASARSLSFGDTVVMGEFCRELYRGKGGKCFELENGTQMDITEVMKYVKEEQGAENE